MHADDCELLDLLKDLQWVGRFCFGEFYDDWQPENWRKRIITKLLHLRDQLNAFFESDEQARKIIEESNCVIIQE